MRCSAVQRFENIGSRIDYTLTDRSFFDAFVAGAQPEPCAGTTGRSEGSGGGYGSPALDTGGADAGMDANSAAAALSAATLNGRWPVAPFEGPAPRGFASSAVRLRGAEKACMRQPAPRVGCVWGWLVGMCMRQRLQVEAYRMRRRRCIWRTSVRRTRASCACALHAC